MGFNRQHEDQDRGQGRDRERGRKPGSGRERTGQSARAAMPPFNPDSSMRYSGKFRARVTDPATGRDKGFAFLQVAHPDTGLTYDVFLHRTGYQGQWDLWQPGDQVQCDITTTSSGLRAEEAEPV